MQIRIAGRLIDAGEGENVLAALARSGIPLTAPCGGRGLCGKCMVTLLEGRITGAEPDDRGRFAACKGTAATDISLELPPGAGSLLRFPASVSGEGFPGGLAGAVERTVSGRAGVALDVGTTTVSAQLIDLESGRTLDTVSLLNDQRVFGADVMSRISAAQKGRTGELFRLINRETQGILEGFIEKHGLGTIERLSVSGNTTMLHLFVNMDPSSMGSSPFNPVFLEKRNLEGRELGLRALTVELLPSVSAFFGADALGALAAAGFPRLGKDLPAGESPASELPPGSLLLDIGTNAEMALFTGGKLLCTSAAAGPVFEGAQISCGSGGVEGAINRVFLRDGRPAYRVIGGGEPRGICGSGLIDAVALMLDQGIIDETGALSAKTGPRGFVIAGDIALSQADLRQFQLAKSAILSGIRILCKKAGMVPGDLCQVYITGGLGFFLDPRSAVRAGLLPPEFLGKIAVSENLSLKAAVQNLLDQGFLDALRALKARCSVVELADEDGFMKEFTENLLFPASSPG
ncbi:MAG: ASKHA domain-containing protein [Treponema sp.]|jgi:uncharacterized 2Fe-2S/4Fe-4S cluster protein (DUF4445 family)|nr:ASKHA domain-containing protein [Treponema sp.]